MGAPHDRPDPPELVGLVRELLRDEVLAAVEGQLWFHVRVAITALDIAERELRLGPGHARAHDARLERLGCGDDAELAARIRAGELDDRYADVARALRELVRDKLAVMNPRYAGPHRALDARED